MMHQRVAPITLLISLVIVALTGVVLNTDQPSAWAAMPVVQASEAPEATATLTATLEPIRTWPTDLPTPTHTPRAIATAFASPSLASTSTVELPTAFPTVPTPKPTEARRPLLFIRAYQTDPATVTAGGEFYLTLELHNVGDREARNVVVTFVAGTFVPTGTSSVKTVHKLAQDEHGMVGQHLRAGKDVASGFYSQVVNLTYEDPDGYTYTASETVGIAVQGVASGRPQLVVGLASTRPAGIAPGDQFDLDVTLRNLGDRVARNVVLALSGGGPFAPLGAGNTRSVTTLGVGQAVTLTFTLAVDANAKPGAYSQGATLEYEDWSGNRYNSQQSVGLVVASRRLDQPLPMITGYTTGRGELQPGEVFTLTLDVQNVGGRRAVRALIALETTQAAGAGAGAGGLGAIAPLESSNVKFLPILEPGEKRTVTQKMAVDGSAASGAYLLTARFTYEDEEGTSYQRSEVISLLVLRPTFLSIELLDAPEELVVGEEVPIAVDVTNLGRYGVNLTTARLESDDFNIRDGSVYIGPLDSGTSGTLDAKVTPRRAGELTLRVAVGYIDDFNRDREVVKEFRLTAREPEALPTPAAAPTAEGESLLSRIGRFLRALFGLGG